MRRRMMWTLECDGCCTVFQSQQRTSDPLVRLARKAGWELTDGQHHCPNCQSPEDKTERIEEAGGQS